MQGFANHIFKKFVLKLASFVLFWGNIDSQSTTVGHARKFVSSKVTPSVYLLTEGKYHPQPQFPITKGQD